MIEVKSACDITNCRVGGGIEEVFIDGAACVGAIVGGIAHAHGEYYARAFVEAIRKTLGDKESIDEIVKKGIEARRAAAH